MAVGIWHIVMMRWGLFFIASGLGWKNLARRSQAARASTATDSMRGGKACTERHFDLDQGDFDVMAPHRLAVMGCRTAETKYRYHLRNRIWEALHGLKDGRTMLSINELHI